MSAKNCQKHNTHVDIFTHVHTTHTLTFLHTYTQSVRGAYNCPCLSLEAQCSTPTITHPGTLTHSHTHSLTHSYTHTHTHTHTHSHTLTHTHTHTHSHTHTLS